MRYQKLPIDLELERLQEDKDGDRRVEEAREAYFAETTRTRGFQLIVALLRDLERTYLHRLRTGTHTKTERLLGRIEGIEEIRRSLTALLPKPQRAGVDWADAEEEDYVNVDEDSPEELSGELE